MGRTMGCGLPGQQTGLRLLYRVVSSETLLACADCSHVLRGVVAVSGGPHSVVVPEESVAQ